MADPHTVLFKRILLPLGEGGPKGRLRESDEGFSSLDSLTRRFAAPSPYGSGIYLKSFSKRTA